MGSSATGKEPFPFFFAGGCRDWLEVSPDAMGSKVVAVLNGPIFCRCRFHRVMRILDCEKVVMLGFCAIVSKDGKTSSYIL